MAIGDKIYNLEINDSEFEREGWKRGRYKGTKLTSAKINKFTEGDITYGKKPVIEQYSKTVYVFNQANSSFETIAGVFYPTTDEFDQTLPDKRIMGSTRFKIDRAVTFTIGKPGNFSQTEPGTNGDDPSFHYFDTLVKTDLALFNSCSVRFFDNANNGFTKPTYNVGYNRGEFKSAAIYFQSSSTPTDVSASSTTFNYGLSNGGRLYINPNIEDWFISQTGASGSQGTIGLGNTSITLDHLGSDSAINSAEGYFFGLSSRLSSTQDSYYISFDQGTQGEGVLNNKNILKAFDIHELEDSGSNINLSNNTFNIKSTGRYGSSFTTTYDGINEEEFTLFREKKLNNIIHLDFNLATEAPAGIGNGGVIIPNNLHPAIKESLNVYLGNAGLGAQGGTTAQFGLGGAVQSISSKDNQQLSSGKIGFQGSGIEEATAGLRQQSATNLAIANQSALGAQLAGELAESSRLTAEEAQDIAQSAGELAESSLLSAEEAQDTVLDIETNLSSTIAAEVSSQLGTLTDDESTSF
jgi:hypothetical protein